MIFSKDVANFQHTCYAIRYTHTIRYNIPFEAILKAWKKHKKASWIFEQGQIMFKDKTNQTTHSGAIFVFEFFHVCACCKIKRMRQHSLFARLSFLSLPSLSFFHMFSCGNVHILDYICPIIKLRPYSLLSLSSSCCFFFLWNCQHIFMNNENFHSWRVWHVFFNTYVVLLLWTPLGESFGFFSLSFISSCIHIYV